MLGKFFVMWIVLFALSFFIEEIPQPAIVVTPEIKPEQIKEKIEIVKVEEPVIEKPKQSDAIYRRGYIGYPQQFGFAA